MVTSIESIAHKIFDNDLKLFFEKYKRCFKMFDVSSELFGEYSSLKNKKILVK